MKQPMKKLLSLALASSMVLGMATTAQAAFQDFTDVKGHWAEATLQQAYEDGILQGSSTTTMAPNSSLTTAQAVTILCRVLHVTGQGDTSGFPIPEGAWYAQDVAKAVYAGLLDQRFADTLDQPIPRGEAFLLFARAFQLMPTQPDLSVLDQFPDTKYLTGDTAEAAAALVNALLEAKGLEPGAASVDWQAYAQQQYDKLAAGLRASLDMKRIYRILNGEE